MSYLHALVGRLLRKLLAMAPILLASLVFFLICWGVLYLCMPLLPVRWQETIALLNDGDWRQARDAVREILDSTGTALELGFVALQTLQVLIAPIPGQLAGLAGGWIFGFWYGLLLTMIGLAIGSLLAMSLGRLFGEQIVRRFVPSDLMTKLDQLISQGGLWNFFIIFLLPALPDDAVCFVAGLTRLNLGKLLAVMFVGRLPGMAVLCYVGATAADDSPLGVVVLSVAMGVSLVLWLFSEDIEAWFFGKNDPPAQP